MVLGNHTGCRGPDPRLLHGHGRSPCPHGACPPVPAPPCPGAPSTNTGLSLAMRRQSPRAQTLPRSPDVHGRPALRPAPSQLHPQHRRREPPDPFLTLAPPLRPAPSPLCTQQGPVINQLVPHSRPSVSSSCWPRHRGTEQGPGCPGGRRGCGGSLTPELSAAPARQTRGNSSPGLLLDPHPRAFHTPKGSSGLSLLPSSALAPPHPRPPPSASARSLHLFHQAQDGFLNKSKKLHFLLGKSILSHFISFPPIFFPNNAIK